jgi:hypothetical protein
MSRHYLGASVSTFVDTPVISYPCAKNHDFCASTHVDKWVPDIRKARAAENHPSFFIKNQTEGWVSGIHLSQWVLAQKS